MNLVEKLMTVDKGEFDKIEKKRFRVNSFLNWWENRQK